MIALSWHVEGGVHEVQSGLKLTAADMIEQFCTRSLLGIYKTSNCRRKRAVLDVREEEKWW